MLKTLCPAGGSNISGPAAERNRGNARRGWKCYGAHGHSVAYSGNMYVRRNVHAQKYVPPNERFAPLETCRAGGYIHKYDNP